MQELMGVLVANYMQSSLCLVHVRKCTTNRLTQPHSHYWSL